MDIPLTAYSMIFRNVLLVVFVASAGTVSAQTAALADVPAGCNAEIRLNRPKVYIANFYVTYGKADMGKNIGDYIAQRFETDGRFELVPRAAISETMSRFLTGKKISADQYLQRTLALAAGENADCVIFGRISKKKNKVSFSVRMSSVSSGASARKVDTDVERDAALGFLEGIGDSFVSYFVTAAPVPVADNNTEGRHRGFHLSLTAGSGYLTASKPIGSDSFSVDSFAGHAGLKIGAAIRPDVILFGAFDGFIGFSPVGKLQQSGIQDAVSFSELSHNILTAGAGLKLYSEENYFFSASLGFATGTLGYSNNGVSTSGNSGYGVAVQLSLGREWWIAQRLGIGIALTGHYSNLPGNSVSVNQYYAGLGISASYN